MRWVRRHRYTSVEIRLTRGGGPAAERGNPVVCSGRFGGASQTPVAIPPSGRGRGRRSPRPLALSSPPAASGSSSDANEAAGTYPVKVTEAEFPTRAATSARPRCCGSASATTAQDDPGPDRDVSIAGKEGRTPTCPSASTTPSRGSPSPTARSGCSPAHYPKFAGSAEPGGAETSNPKTYDFGPLKPGATTERGLEAERREERPLHLLYAIDAGLGGEAKAKTAGGAEPGGSFAARIVGAPPDKVVNGAGEVVETEKPSSGR